MEFGTGDLEEGGTYEVKVDAKNPKGEGIGHLRDVVVFIRNAKARSGKTYTVKITKLHRTFAYAEPLENSKYFIGNGSLII
ncbi:MAG: TRAM domain-containing protein [Candidatus Marsarchaeota archaeon]|jgi:predicted RNA-binding protein with TRAM domain|nr:TRAM domain-containing protein [Candidatus Marsarchaeota archaeon]